MFVVSRFVHSETINEGESALCAAPGAGRRRGCAGALNLRAARKVPHPTLARAARPSASTACDRVRASQLLYAAAAPAAAAARGEERREGGSRRPLAASKMVQAEQNTTLTLKNLAPCGAVLTAEVQVRRRRVARALGGARPMLNAGAAMVAPPSGPAAAVVGHAAISAPGGEPGRGGGAVGVAGGEETCMFQRARRRDTLVRPPARLI